MRISELCAVLERTATMAGDIEVLVETPSEVLGIVRVEPDRFDPHGPIVLVLELEGA